MNWNLLEYFVDEQVQLTPVIITTAIVNGYPQETETVGTPISGLKFTKSAASRYFEQSFQTEFNDVFITGDVSQVSKGHLLRYVNVDFEADEPENVATQNDVYVIGLKRKV